MVNRAWGRQALLLFMAAIVLYMGGGFVRQIFVGRQQRAVLQDIKAQIEAAEQEQAALQAQLEYGQSQPATEEWARENGWARSDEQLVIVVAPTAEAATNLGEDASGPAASESLRDTWWDLFFGGR